MVLHKVLVASSVGAVIAFPDVICADTDPHLADGPMSGVVTGGTGRSVVAFVIVKLFHVPQLHQALFLCALFLFRMENVHLFSSSFPRFDKCHETSRIFPRNEQTFASARSFGVIS